VRRSTADGEVPPTTGSHVIDEIWKDALGGCWKCAVASTPGTWKQMLPVAMTADPASGTIPTGYLFFSKGGCAADLTTFLPAHSERAPVDRGKLSGWRDGRKCNPSQSGQLTPNFL
jgi:hypothetical protein